MRSTPAFLVLLAVACKSEPPPVVTTGVTLQQPPIDEEDVQPVYPVQIVPHPRAQAYCAAVAGLPWKRRAECCKTTPGFTLESECVRTLSGALAFQAVTLRDVDRCAEAMKRATAGCEWAAPTLPPLPAECVGIVQGTLGAGARCRSSLECAGGMRCKGVGPTDAGRCAPPGEDGAACGGSVDALVTYTRQEDHRECTGWCNRRRCMPCVDDKCDAAPLAPARRAMDCRF